MVTVEAAFAISAIVSVVVAGLAGLSAVAIHVRCVDAAREAVRVAAYSDGGRGVSAGSRVAPGGARVAVSVSGEIVTATVNFASVWFFGVELGSRAVAEREPAGR